MPTLRSGPLAAWANAWLAGRVSADDVLDAVRGTDGPHRVRAVEVQAVEVAGGDGADVTSVLDLLAQWRRSGAAVRLVLPVPGDVRGVPGPAPFLAAALDAGEAVHAGGLGAVPIVTQHPATSAPPAVVWHVFRVAEAPPDQLDLREAQHELASAVRECASALAAVDVAGTSGPGAEELHRARSAGDHLNLPPGWPGPAVALLAQAERLQAVLDVALLDPVGGAVDTAGIAARHHALRPLATAVRRGRLAAYNARALN